MAVVRWDRLSVLGVGLLALGCGGGDGGGTQPPGPPADVVPSAGDAQFWYFNNPLPTPLGVTVKDAGGRGVPGVEVTWAVAPGGGVEGAVNPTHSTTNANGIASTTDSIGAVSQQTVTATVTGLPGPATFTEQARAPAASGAVSVGDDFFSPRDTVVGVNGTVTWTWGGINPHSVTFGTGTPTSPTQMSGTYQRTFTSTGSFSYFCKVHANMNGTVRVVH